MNFRTIMARIKKCFTPTPLTPEQAEARRRETFYRLNPGKVFDRDPIIVCPTPPNVAPKATPEPGECNCRCRGNC